MRLFVMRHGQAEPVAATDEQRALTNHGRAEVATVAKQHLAHITFDQVYVSPYLRAQQSWQEIQNQGVKFNVQETVNWITPDVSPQKAIDHLLERSGDAEAILLVCHQPFVGRVTTLLCDGHDHGLPIATGGLVSMDTEVIARQCAMLNSIVSP